MDATHPFEPANTTVPGWDWLGLIGRVSLPTWPGATGGVQSGPAVVVVVADVVTAAAVVDAVLEDELEELEDDTASALPIGCMEKFLS
jgi:hypothetical protein